MADFSFGQLKIDAAAYGSQGSAILGIRDSGKTYTATLIAERLFDAGVPFIAFDPIGVWRFLRVPGKGRGIPVVVAGGVEGDLSLTPATAPAIVEAAMQNGVSLVIDLFHIDLSKADWRRIVRDSVRLLLHKNSRHGLRHVFIEEAAEFAPQKVYDGEVYAEIEKLGRMGGNSRLGYTLINQRAEEVNKAVLELCDNLFLHRQKGRNSLIALGKWLDVGNVKDGKAIIDTLATLPTGDCWAWLAGTDTPVRVKVPAKNSLHPDRRVMHGDGEAIAKKAVDVGTFVEGMKASLPKIAEEAKANDPKALRAVIASLRKQMTEAAAVAARTGTAIDPRALEEAGRSGYNDGLAEGHAKAVFSIAKELREIAAATEAANTLAQSSLGALEATPRTVPAAARPSRTAPPVKPIVASTPKSKAPATPAPPPGDLTNPQRQLLKALAWWNAMGHERPSRAQVAAIAGWKITSGHFKNVVGSLRTSGLVNYPSEGVIELTPAGASAAPEPDLSVTLLDGIRGVLSNPQRQIFEVLVNHSRPVAREDIAQQCGWEPTSGHLKNVIGSLRTLEVVEYPSAGMVGLQAWVTG